MPELIITGIARSGTSYLCNLLHRYSNCVVLNEPAEVFPPLIDEEIPWSLATFYRQTRADILAGVPIRNKLRDGAIPEDTGEHEEVHDYTPLVDREDFVLGVKNNRAFLSQLDAIRRAMPAARVVACVRNPFDTIASWKRTFPHLWEANVRRGPVGHLDDPRVPVAQRDALAAIVGVAEVAERRARWWQYLAALIRDQGDRVIVVDYAAIVTQPEAVAERVLRASRVRGYRALLDAADEQAIRAVCIQTAADLGLRW